MVGPVPIDWHAVETWLGLRLPADYKDLATRHGPLDIGEFVWMHVPCVQPGRFDYGTWLLDTHRRTRVASRDAPPHEPPPFHPVPGGLLAWGTTRATSELFWDTSACDDPDEWPVVLFDRDAVYQKKMPFVRVGLPLTATLEMLMNTGLELPSGTRLGPLPPTSNPTAFLPRPLPWTPPAQRLHDPARRRALAEGSGLETLAVLAPPPRRPYLGEGTWERLFDRLGTRLPADYLALMELYGAGCWSQWLEFPPPPPGFEEVMEGFRRARLEYPDDQPLPIWPDPGGFLPFAHSIDGDFLGWLTTGEPDAWPLIAVPRHSEQGQPLPGGLIDTMLDWLRGEPVFGFVERDPDDDPLDLIGFQPWDEWSAPG